MKFTIDTLSHFEEIVTSLGFVVHSFKIEDESAEYEACEFTLNDHLVKHRSGKITPTKVGQFVTFWKRIGSGPIRPYDESDPFDVLIVSVKTENNLGQFIFPKKVLCEKGLVSCGDKEGKRAMRVYPAWDKAENTQAKKTQKWQLKYFVDLSKIELVDPAIIQQLLLIQEL